jgi:rod shape-determining protein MreD
MMRISTHHIVMVRRIALVLIALFIQITAMSKFSILGIQPSLLLATFFLFAVRSGAFGAVWLGFAIGTLLDVYAPGAAGCFAFSLSLVGFLAGLFYEKTVHTEYFTRVFLLGLAVVIHDSSWFLFSGYGMNLLMEFVFRTALPSAIYTMVLGAALFAIRPSGRNSELPW